MLKSLLHSQPSQVDGVLFRAVLADVEAGGIRDTPTPARLAAKT